MRNRLLLLLAVLIPSVLFAQDPLFRTRKAVSGVEITPEVAALAEVGPVSDVVLQGMSTVHLFAYLSSEGNFYAQKIFPIDGARVFAVGDRIVWECEKRLGPLHVRTSIHYDVGAKHVEGSVLFLNSESVNPVGDVKTDWLGLGVGDGVGVFHGRAAVPFGMLPVYLEGDQNISTWQLSYTKHIAGGNMVPFPFVVGFGGNSYNLRAYSEPDHIRKRGDFLIPAPVFDPQDVAAEKSNALNKWRAFQFDRRGKDPAYLFGDTIFTGSAGSQARLGKHPCMRVVNPQISSGYASDYHRSKVMWVEGRRKYWLDWPTGDNEAYNFYGLHWTSRWKAGYTRNQDGSWTPPFGDDHGVSGHNLEHLRSKLPELAFYTQDPQLMWMTSRLGRLILCTITADGINDGGYYGGGFSSMRAFTRPIVELMECVVALKSYGDVYAEDIALFERRISDKLAWMVQKNPRWAKKPDRPDEQIPGHEGELISEVWQAGIGGDYLWSWFLLTGDTNAFELAVGLQQMHIEAWRGASVGSLEMPKQVLTADWSIGRGYNSRHDFLVGWNYSLMSIPDLPGIDQDRRRMITDSILFQYPGTPWTAWGCRSWTGFQPMNVQNVKPWYQN